jgi:hypothetical protein
MKYMSLFFGLLILLTIFSGTVFAVTTTFNVYPTGTSTNLTKIDMDCTNNTYDLNNQTSPFSQDMALGTYTCGFLVNNGINSYDRNTITFSVSGVGSNTIYLNPNWWNNAWRYREQITVTAPSDQNTYQWSKLIVHTNSSYLISNQKLQQDCNDFRIVDTNNMTLYDIGITG